MDKRTLSIGKIRGLQRVSTPNKSIALLAVDHRNNLRSLLKPDSPGSVSDAEMVGIKKQVVAELGLYGSGVLLDPVYGAAQCISSGALPTNRGLVVALEQTGYTGGPSNRLSQRLPGWSVEKIRRMGADAVKLLVYYHPQSSTAPEIEELVAGVAQECKDQDLPLFLESLSYSLDPYAPKLTSAERSEVVIESLRRLSPMGADVFEAEFPVDLNAGNDEILAKACEDLTSASAIPWVLISSSTHYYDYMREVNIACRSGASGVAVGRAIWQEAVPLSVDKRREFLQQVTRPRMERLTALCNAMAQPWSDCYSLTEPSTDWYQKY
jgi:tagatose-1,6-bisphosphate aldolase